MPHLFDPLAIGPVHAPNRIAIAPMCQYSSNDGCASDWHLQHIPMMAMSGAGLVILEATGVERAGRITHGCLGLYSDDNERALRRALEAAKAVALPGTLFGVQLAHAGRKASSQIPWKGGSWLRPDEDPWRTSAPVAEPFAEGWPVPVALDDAGVQRLIDSFAEAAGRAARIGFDVIELHMAHGYLMHEFLSPLVNRRSDKWGELSRFPLEVGRAVAAAIPKTMAWGARITGSDWIEGGITPVDAARFAGELRRAGAHFVDVSSGSVSPQARVQIGPGYQVPFAAEVKRANPDLVVSAVGLIVDAQQADGIVSSGQADQIAIGRGALDDPRWGWRAAEKLGVEITRPPQYARTAPKLWPG
ncbi:MAG: NADH:flavin oxidoreductase/NADH oxidase, partial [Rhodospirillales bacterium]|nr:NADH:flavin oxidoreductase/NADH oxidase [Rhodospirillales bacterium]